ncbi:hypothetical protein GIB67_016286, partial [Kingdonia uniflora]
DLNAFKSLKAGGTGNSLSLKKLNEHYAYKLEKVLSDGTVVAAKKKKGLTAMSVARAYMLYVLGSFLFPTKKGTYVSARYLYLFTKDKVAKKWLWGSTVLAHIYYNLGAASRDDGRQFPCCTTLFEVIPNSFILLGSPRRWTLTHTGHCTCWKWDVSVMDRYGGTSLLKFRKTLDNYKLEDVVWDPYRDKRDFAHTFKEVTFFYGALANPDHVQPYYPNRVVWQFNREQSIPTKRLLIEVSNLWNAKEPRKFNPKFEWIDCFSSQKWKEFILNKADRGQRVREGPLVYDDVGIHQRKPASVNEHGDTPVHQSKYIPEQYDASHHEYASLSSNINLNDQQITTLNDQLQKLKEDKEKESEANINLREALKEKTSKCDLLKETIKQMKEKIELKRVVDEQCALEFADLPRQLDAKILECKNLKENKYKF